VGNSGGADEDQGYAVKVGKTLYVKNRREWRRWLAKYHESAAEIWLIYYKKVSGKPRLGYFLKMTKQNRRFGMVQ
jgi:hypothetical protein